jgi:histone deacetylase 6
LANFYNFSLTTKKLLTHSHYNYPFSLSSFPQNICMSRLIKGEMEVTPACYSHLLAPLMSLALGRVAVVLEGGYCLESLAEGAALTLKTLLGDPCPVMEPLEAPCER